MHGALAPPAQVATGELEAKLGLAEFLLASTDLQVSARRAVDWLIAQTPIKHAVVVLSDPSTHQLVIVAEHGVSSSAIADFALTRDDEAPPLIKAMHELGHATATHAGGGEVHDMGVMMLVLFPVPYVDASGASALGSKWRRALVGAGGMIAEVFVAALAMFAWTLLEPGLARAAMFNVMLVAGVSTVLVNGNPLLRFDG